MTARPALVAVKHVLGAREFRLFQRLILREAGIQLVDAKRVLVEGRLARRLRELDLDFPAYYALVEADAAERVRMLDCISTNETHFFREPKQFEFLESRLLPEWQARVERLSLPRRFRVWSAGCSTGEEPYSVAMSFLARFPPGSGFEISVLATRSLLARARRVLRPRSSRSTSRPRSRPPTSARSCSRARGRRRAG